MEPIEELQVSVMEELEAAHARGVLEQAGCRMTYMSERGGYFLIRFPAGTVEEKPTNPDPRFRDETVILLPNGLKVRKFVHWPCVRSWCNHTRLMLSEEKLKSRRARYA